jgi:hypothetical protein
VHSLDKQAIKQIGARSVRRCRFEILITEEDWQMPRSPNGPYREDIKPSLMALEKFRG